MCGIAGLWDRSGRPVTPDTLRAMAALLERRGPDGSGVLAEGPVGLAHTRLAILDLDARANQPMTSADGRFSIVYNGEVYNFVELMGELEARGHRFRSSTDTEVVLAAYAEWGPQCLERFNGAWAFAIRDRARDRMFLARDRFGVRPLHYLVDGDRFAFASEMKAFLPLDGFQATLDPGVAARALLNFNHVEGTEEGLFAGVRRLPAGCSLTLERDGPPVIARWWRTLDHLPEAPGDPQARTERFEELLRDACRIRLRSDVPVATALSGGLDSSSVHAMVAELARAGRDGDSRRASDCETAFIASFPGTPWDERPFAEAVARTARTRPVVTAIDPAEALAHLDRILFDFEEIYDIPVAPWLLYRSMRRHGYRVSLDGHGGDELLAGYHHHYHAGLAAGVEGVPAEELRRTLDGMTAPALHTLPRPLPDRAAFLRAAPSRAPFVGRDEALAWLSHRDAMTRTMYDDFHHTILPTILRNFDRLSMAHGVEIRAPFLDWRLVCYAFALPVTDKVGGGLSKLILRRALGVRLPEVVRRRTTKMGFVSPLADWMNGPLRGYALDIVHSAGFLASDVWDGPKLRDLMDRAAREDDGQVLRWGWDFVMAQRLQDLFRGRRRTPEAARPPD